MPRRRTVLRASLATTLVAATAGLATLAHERLAPGAADDAGCRPIAWPFPRDAWPAGQAWRRGTTEVYVRPPGRSRLYRYTVGNGAARQAEGIAVSGKSDFVVAVILDDGENRAATHRFLSSGTVHDWITRQLEGR